MMAKHAVLTAQRTLDIQERASAPLGKEEVRIAVSCAGVCGTDLALYKGDYPVPLPLTLGHEFCGVVSETGSSEWEGLIDKRATAEINNSCVAKGETSLCEACGRGMPEHCQGRTVLGIIGCDGAFAGEVVVPARNVHPIPDSISDREAVFIEPVAAALRTFAMGPIGREGRSKDASTVVAVLGVGRLGLLIAAVAKSLRARVIGIGRSKEKCERAAPYCDVVVATDSAEETVKAVFSETNLIGADYVIEATGSADGLARAVDLVRPRGTIALKSTPGLPASDFDLTKIVVNEIRLQGSRCGPFDRAIEFIGSGQIDLKPLVAETYPLEAAQQAIEAAASVSKVLIQCAK